MIKAVHTLIYSDDAEATRAFLRDVLGWPSVQDTSSTPDWPIFDRPERGGRSSHLRQLRG